MHGCSENTERKRQPLRNGPILGVQEKVKLRYQHYKAYFVLCQANTTHSAGWLVCQYAKTGGCLLEKALHSFRTVQGGTSRL